MRATKCGLLYWSAMVVLCLGLSLGVSGSLWAAPTFVNANDPGLPGKANGVPKGGALNVFDLELEGEGTVTLELERFEVFAPDAECTVVGDNGSTAFDPPSDAYFRGWSDHDPETVVMMAVTKQGTIRGLITGSTGAWLLEGPTAKGKGLQNRKADLEAELSGRSFECGTNGLQSTAASAGSGATGAAAALAAGLPPATNVQYTAYVIVDTDYEYLQNFAGDAGDAFTYMGDLFAFVSSVYEREIDTNLLISQARLWASDFDPYVLNNAGCTIAGSLQELTAEWSADPTPRTTVHLLSGKTAGQGCAAVGVLCSFASGYGVSMGIGLGYGGPNLDIDNPVIFWDSYVVAHEIGHNFNSPHTQGYCTIDAITDPVDVCAAVEGACVAATYAGIIGSLPGPGALTGGTAGAGNGTLRSI
jgi:Metallo-peptidase family M12